MGEPGNRVCSTLFVGAEDGFIGEVVDLDDAGVQGREVQHIHVEVDARLRLNDDGALELLSFNDGFRRGLPLRCHDVVGPRDEVVEAVRNGQFYIYAAKTIDEGIEVLTGVPAGKRKKDGTYPAGTINFLVDKQLREMAERLRGFYTEEKKEVRG